MIERRQDFLARFDWIRTGLYFEPRGHDMMSGGFLYPPTREDADCGILFIETSGCLPMCGHGTIGMVTFGLEHGLITPRVSGKLRIEVPAGIIDIDYGAEGNRVRWVRIRNVPAYVDVPGFGPLSVDVSGNYYAIVEPQGPYTGLRSRCIAHRRAQPRDPYLDARRDRTGASVHKGQLMAGDRFVHESYIGSRFIGRVEEAVDIGGVPGIIPSIEGSAIATGFNTIWIDRGDPFWAGFSVV